LFFSIDDNQEFSNFLALFRMSKCIFCDIVSGTHSKILRQQNGVTVFKDIDCLTNHTLAVPDSHIENAKHLAKSDIDLVKELENQSKKALKLLRT
jgi:diadenosine tetraphosphate (Ap4A) HIT family hydrolase